jgi:hypothetical protein
MEPEGEPHTHTHKPEHKEAKGGVRRGAHTLHIAHKQRACREGETCGWSKAVRYFTVHKRNGSACVETRTWGTYFANEKYSAVRGYNTIYAHTNTHPKEGKLRIESVRTSEVFCKERTRDGKGSALAVVLGARRSRGRLLVVSRSGFGCACSHPPFSGERGCGACALGRPFARNHSSLLGAFVGTHARLEPRVRLDVCLTLLDAHSADPFRRDTGSGTGHVRLY